MKQLCRIIVLSLLLMASVGIGDTTTVQLVTPAPSSGAEPSGNTQVPVSAPVSAKTEVVTPPHPQLFPPAIAPLNTAPLLPPPPTNQPGSDVVSGSWRSLFIDWAAALFGFLAVIFALLTLLLFYKGYATIKDVAQHMERDLKERVKVEFEAKLSTVIEQEVRPKIQQILDQELRRTLDTVEPLVEAEIRRNLSDSAIRQGLIDNVTGEIIARLSIPRGGSPRSGEFE